MTFRVTTQVVDALLAHAARAYPRECCGILLGKGGEMSDIIAAENVHPEPETHFEIDPESLIDAHRAARSGGAQVIGYYHSHPNGLARPSAVDSASAPGNGSVWAIVAKGAVSWWLDAETGFERLSLAGDKR